MKLFMSIYSVFMPHVFTEEVIEISVPVSECISRLVDQCACVARLMGVVKETKQHFLEREDIAKLKLQLTVCIEHCGDNAGKAETHNNNVSLS